MYEDCCCDGSGDGAGGMYLWLFPELPELPELLLPPDHLPLVAAAIVACSLPCWPDCPSLTVMVKVSLAEENSLSATVYVTTFVSAIVGVPVIVRVLSTKERPDGSVRDHVCVCCTILR